MFEIVIEKRVLSDCDHLSADDKQWIFDKIHSRLAVNPFPTGKNPKRLSGKNAYRYRVGDAYR